jgi:hypothetical protein
MLDKPDKNCFFLFRQTTVSFCIGQYMLNKSPSLWLNSS